MEEKINKKKLRLIVPQYFLFNIIVTLKQLEMELSVIK